MSEWWFMMLDLTVRAVVTCVTLLTGFAYMTWTERRVVARMQWRLGPNRVGPQGLLQPLADGVKLLFKEQLIPAQAKVAVFLIAPMISLIVALSSFAVIPVDTEQALLSYTTEAHQVVTGQSQMVHVLSHPIKPFIADVNVSVLFLLGITSLAVYGIVLGGWSSGNKYSLIGSIRSSAQMVSYELALGTALLSPLLMVGSLSFVEIANHQREFWLVVSQPLAFILFCIAAVAETNRAPFDLPEAEQELGAGFHTEYSGMRFALFFMAEYTAMITVSAVATTAFLGGPTLLPFAILGFQAQSFIFFIMKILGFMFVYIWLRATFPRFRYDQLMRIGWQVLLPLGVINLVVTALGVVLHWHPLTYTGMISSLVVGAYLVGKMSRGQADG